MAMQTGIGLSRIIFLVGAGYTGTVLVKNGKLSDLIGELQNLVKGLENSGDSANADADPIAAQVRWLAQEVRQLASTRQITVLNGSSGQTDVTSLIIPVATLGAVGYGYMWWKGFSFSDLMYVTKRSMAAAVANLTEHLQNVSETLEKAKKHLTQRIQNLDGKMDEQREISKLIMNEVQDTRGDIDKVTNELYFLSNKVLGLGDKMRDFEDKQNLTLLGVDYLIDFVDGKTTKGVTLSQYAQEKVKIAGRSRGQLPASESIGLQGLMSITDGELDLNGQRKTNLMRSISAKVAKV